MSDIGLNYRLNLDVSPENYQTTQTKETAQTQKTTFVDGTQSMGGASEKTLYTASMSAPKLADVLYGLSDSVPGYHQESEATPTHAYYDAFSEELQSLVDQNGLSEDDTNKLIEAHFLETPLEDPKLKQALTQLNQGVAENLVQLFDLPPVGDQSSNVAKKGNDFLSSAKQQIQELKAYIQTLPEGSEKQQLMQKLQQMESSLQSFQTALDAAQNSSDRASLAANTETLNKLVGQFEEQLGDLSKMGGEDPNLGNALSSFKNSMTQGTTELKGTFSEIALSYQLSQGDYSKLTESVKNTYITLLSNDYASSFKNALQNPTGLNDSELALLKDSQGKLEFIFNNRESLNSFGPDIAALFNKLNGGVLQSLSLPPGYEPPVDNTAYMSNLTKSADDTFEQVLDNYVAKNGLPPEEAAKLKNIYFGVTPGSLPPELEAQIQAAMISQVGIPEGFPTPKGAFHSLNIQGQFMQQIMTLIDGLPPEQKQAVLAALSDPLNAAVTPEIKALIQKLFNSAATSIRQQFSLPDDWSPPVSLLGEISKVPVKYQQMNHMLNELDLQINLMAKTVQSWPESPTKALFLNILKIVSDALSRMKAQVAVIQMMDAEMGKLVSKAQLDAALTKAEENIKKMEEMREKAKKMATMGPFMKVIKYLFAAIMFMFGLGPIILAVMIAGDIQGKDYLKEAFVAISKGITESMGDGPGAHALAMLVQILLIAAICFVAGPLAGMTVFFENSGIIDKFFTDICGLDPVVGQAMTMAVQMIVEIAVMILLCIVTGGAGGALMGAQISARVAQISAKVASKVAQVLVSVIQKLTMVAEKCAEIGGMMGKVGKLFNKAAQALDDIVVNLIKYQSELEKYADEMLQVADVMKPHLKNQSFTQQAKSALGGGSGNQELDICVKIVEKEINLMKSIMTGIGVVTSTVEGAALVTNVNNSIVQAEISRIKGILEAMMVELEAQIQIMKKLFQKLIESLQGMATWMGDINTVQTQMWAGQSQALDAVTNANAA